MNWNDCSSITVTDPESGEVLQTTTAILGCLWSRVSRLEEVLKTLDTTYKNHTHELEPLEVEKPKSG